MPKSKEEVSLGGEEFIVLEEPLDQERFKRQLIAIAQNLKKKQQQLKAEHDTLNERWTKVLGDEEYDQERPVKSYPRRKLLPQFDDEVLEPIPSKYNHADQPDRPPCGRDKAAYQAEHQPAPPRRRGRETAAAGYTYDLQRDLANKAG